MTSGETRTLKIDDIAYLGSGVSRTDEGAVFTPGVCLGETVGVQITHVKKGFARARLLEVIQPSPDRLDPPACEPLPGIAYGHLAYPAELAAKQKQLENFLTRQAAIPAETLAAIIQPPGASPAELHYRNKIVLHAGENRGYRTLGYKGDDNRSVIDVPECPLAAAPINAELAKLRHDPRFLKKLRTGDNLTLRWTETDGVLHWVDAPPRETRLTEKLSIGELSVSAGGFFQVNTPAADLLLQSFMERFAQDRVPKAHLIDLYCGAGLFACAAAQAGARRITGIELNSDAIHSARLNAKARNLEATFTCADSAQIAQGRLALAKPEETALVVDPPREGLSPKALEAIIRHPPAALFYISCGPDTLARDLKLLLANGYRPIYARLIDFFPRTPHFETLIQLERTSP